MTKPRLLALGIAILCAFSMWFYIYRVLIPFQVHDAAEHDRPRGNLSDLYPRWLGARELLLHHRDPYSPELTREIQAGYYGRALDSSRPKDPKDQQAFAYPVYVVFFLAPTIYLPFTVVQPLFQWLLLFLTLLSVWLWLKAVHWRPNWTVLCASCLFSLFNYPAVQGIKRQQISLLVCVLIAAAVTSMMRNRLWISGFFLAAATIKPQLALLPMAWFMLWAVSDFRKRSGLVYGFTAMMSAFLISSEMVLPGWVPRFRGALLAYTHYADGLGSTLDALLTPLVGRFLAALILIGASILLWRWRRSPAGSPQFIFNTALVLAVTVVVLPMTSPYNQLLLLPAIFLLIRDWPVLTTSRVLRTVTLICGTVIVWPWLVSASLALAYVAMPAESVQRAWAVPLYSSFAIPSAVLALMSVHWWKNRPELTT